MPSHIHFWSDIPGDWHPSTRRDASKHEDGAAGDRLVVEITSVGDFKTKLQDFLAKKRVFNDMDFHTHGSPGVVGMGADGFRASTLDRFAALSFETLMAKDAQVVFTGCNCGQGPWGELLLAAFGLVFLKANGGAVAGNTGDGVADFLFTGNVFHPLGSWVSAVVTTGGAVSLQNHSHLDLKFINPRIDSCQRRIGILETRRTKCDLSRARDLLNHARAKVAGAVVSFRQMADACDALTDAENNLDACEVLQQATQQSLHSKI